MNSVIFHFWHGAASITFWKISLQSGNLIPTGLEGTMQGVDPVTGRIKPLSLSDPLPYYTNTTLLESYLLTFGENCYIYEEMIEPINRIIRNEPAHIPVAIKRLQKALPKELFTKYFPDFAQNKTGYYFHIFSDVGECNTECNPIPMFTRYTDNENGKRQMVRFTPIDLNIDLLNPIMDSQEFWTQMINDLNKYGYCSPYVTDI